MPYLEYLSDHAASQAKGKPNSNGLRPKEISHSLSWNYLFCAWFCAVFGSDLVIKLLVEMLVSCLS